MAAFALSAAPSMLGKVPCHGEMRQGYPLGGAFILLRSNLTQRSISALLFGLTFNLSGLPAFCQSDPGPRAGAASAGHALPYVSAEQQSFFAAAQQRFMEIEDVPTNGLGPRFNSNSCFSCHAYPAVGGSSPKSNPQVAFANGSNSLPSFITANGPVREVRFVAKADGTADGGVHSLFTIMGQPGTPSSCKLTQENFSNLSNLGLRIPTPLYGLGLVEAVSDATLTANLSTNPVQKALLGIAGRFNRSGNDGTITRFGWKAQNKSLHIFSGEAYNVEMGITNLLFPNERDDTAGCNPVGAFNDSVNLDASGYDQFDDVSMFASFMRLLAPPSPGPASLLSVRGQAVFAAVGCAYCHTPSLQTGATTWGNALSNQTIAPYSDFALHHMGPGLADRISQGVAQGDEFRTAPLWGIGQRLFFLHDGRTSDLVASINAHYSLGNFTYGPSESNGSVLLYNLLPPSDKQALLTFLRSL